MKPLALVLVGPLLLVGWLARDPGGSGQVVIRRGVGVMLLAFLAMASPVVAQEEPANGFRPAVPPGEWMVVPGVSSASLALTGTFAQTGTAGWSLPDERQAVVTFWTSPRPGAVPQVYRCVAVFDAELAEVEEACALVVRSAE